MNPSPSILVYAPQALTFLAAVAVALGWHADAPPSPEVTAAAAAAASLITAAAHWYRTRHAAPPHG